MKQINEGDLDLFKVTMAMSNLEQHFVSIFPQMVFLRVMT